MAILLELPSETEALLREQAKSSGKELGQYIVSLIKLKKTSIPSTSKRETELLSIIKNDFPASFWARFRQLTALRSDVKLTKNELEELMQMSEALEENNGKQMEAFVELSKLRGVELETLMNQLGFKHAQNF